MPDRSSATNEGAEARAPRAATANSATRDAVTPRPFSATPSVASRRDMGRADLGSRMRFLQSVQRSAGNSALQRSTPIRSIDGPEAGRRVVAPSPPTVEVQRVPGVSNSVAASAYVQRVPAGTGGSPSPASAAASATARNEIELLGSRLKINQINLTSFLRDANADITNIRAYFKWLNDVYARCYQHYALVIAQAGAEAQTEQAWLDFASGVAIGATVGLISEAAIAGRVAEKALESVTEVAAEFAEGGIGSFAKFDVPKPALSTDAPALKQVATLAKLDELNAAVLPAAISGSLYLDPIVQSERLTAELRVAEAGGARRMSDADVQEMRLKLMRFEVSSSQSDRVVTTAAAAFDALRKRYQGQQPPSDQRTEQDIWIPWITQQSGAPQLNLFITPVLSRTVLANHLVDIGLAGRGAPGGRLNADISQSRRTKPDDILTTKEPHQQLILGARAEAPAIPPFWAKLLLND